MIDWHELWRNPSPGELDIVIAFGLSPPGDQPLVGYCVTLERRAQATLVLTAVHSRDPFELSRYQNCKASWGRYRPCTTLAELEILRSRPDDPSETSLTRRELGRFVGPSNVSPAAAGRFDALVSGLVEILQDPGSYHWPEIREGLLQIYFDAAKGRFDSHERETLHGFVEGLLGFISLTYYLKWLIGLGDCESDPDFDQLDYPRVDPEWKRMQDWENDLKWCVRDTLRCDEKFSKDPDLRRALEEFRTLTGFELRLIKRKVFGAESCVFEIPELSLFFGDLYGKRGAGFTSQDQMLQGVYREVVAPVQGQILDRLMEAQQLSEASIVSSFDPPPGSIKSLQAALAWEPGRMPVSPQEQQGRDPSVGQPRHYEGVAETGRHEVSILEIHPPELRQTAALLIERIWCDQYGPVGLRQDLQTQLIERLEILEGAARALTTQPRRLQSAYYKLFFELETKLRDFIRTVLENELGSTWWESGVPDNVRKKCCAVKADVEQHGENPLHPFEYCSFAHLKRILEKQWDTKFKKFFEDEGSESRDKKLAWIERLIPIRNVLMHPRRPLSIRESWAIDFGSRHVGALEKKLAIYGSSATGEWSPQ